MSDYSNNSEIKGLQWMLGRGRIGRREFIGRSLALGVGGALATSLAGKAVMAAGPKKGGRLAVALGHGSSTDSIDPATLENRFQTALALAVANTLTGLGPNGVLIPGLAKSWEASSDAKTWTFHLRTGVEFHNGKTLEADDVIASINYHRGEGSKSSVLPLVKPIADIKADGPQTVIFTLEAASADFPFDLATPGFTIYPARDGGIDWQAGGTGGYILSSYEPGVGATLKRNPNYWQEGLAHFDEIELLSIHDNTARINALMSGRVHVIDQVDAKLAPLVERRSGLTVEEQAGSLHYTFPMHVNAAPFSDNNVRIALKHAIDREDLLKRVLGGRGTIGNDNPIGPSYRYFASDLEQTAYDPDKARHYLKKSGLSGLKVDLSAADAAFGGAVNASILFQEHAKKAGIDINVVREPNDGYWSNVWLKKPFCACYWGGYATEDTMFATGYAPGAAWNDTKFDHGRFNDLAAQAKGELDEGRRRDMYREMQKILRDDGGVIAPLFANEVFARSDKLAHGDLGAGSGIDGQRYFERWWFA